jgi:hypothetical protein
MRAEAGPSSFRFALHDRVYLLGSAESLTVVGLMWIKRATAGETRRYYLKSRQGDEQLIDEQHVYGAPTRQAVG